MITGICQYRFHDRRFPNGGDICSSIWAFSVIFRDLGAEKTKNAQLEGQT
jgi:hypothetical protein